MQFTVEKGQEQHIAKNCSVAEEIDVCIVIEEQVQDVIWSLCDQIKIEWQMFLCGKQEETETGTLITVNGYWIPKQEITTASVNNLDCVDRLLVEEKQIVAGIHSHGSMGTYFSMVDDETNKSIVPTHLVVNNDHDCVAIHRQMMPCGHEAFVDALVDWPRAKNKIKIEGFDKIKMKQFEIPKHQYRTYQYEKNKEGNWCNPSWSDIDTEEYKRQSTKIQTDTRKETQYELPEVYKDICYG